MRTEGNRRILLIDDNQEIHKDYRKILSSQDAASESALGQLEDALFGASAPGPAAAPLAGFELDSVLQGQEAYAKVRAALAAGRPYAMAFVDMRMPPGWNGVETIARLWDVDPDLQVAICTAYADYSWSEMVATLGRTDKLLILKKPFDAIEVCQIATALTEKWNLTQRERQRVQEAQAAEREARAYAASLETVNRALEQAKASADGAARERSEFMVRMTGGILHPMASLVEGADRIRRLDPTDQGWLELVEGLCRDGQALATSLQDVLDLSALDAGTLALVRGPCDPLDVAEEVRAAAQRRLGTKALELSVVRGAHLPATIETDRGQLVRILTHLVDNAITYTERGWVRLSVAGVPGIPARVVYTVQDSGPGFSAQVRQRLFEPFCHGDAARNAGDGAGIGLYLSRRLARALGGSLALAPDDGTGSRLELTVDGGYLPVRSR
jgi:signal transduction histidine kinase